jgi:hypothetical protein
VGQPRGNRVIHRLMPLLACEDAAKVREREPGSLDERYRIFLAEIAARKEVIHLTVTLPEADDLRTALSEKLGQGPRGTRFKGPQLQRTGWRTPDQARSDSEKLVRHPSAPVSCTRAVISPSSALPCRTGHAADEH